MNFFVIGINYKIAPIEVREKFSLLEVQKDLLLTILSAHKRIFALLVLSTCNRVEIYVEATLPDIKKVILDALFDVKKQKNNANLKEYFYCYQSIKAIEHLFVVASGLDSLVLGENQILGQIKNAFQKSEDLHVMNPFFHLLKKVLINGVKMVRYETEIGFGGSSVSWAAVHLAETHLSGLRNKKALLLGSGHMAELAAKNMYKKSLSRFFIMNRTKEKAIALSERFNAEACSFLDLRKILSEVNFCICCVDAPHYVLEKETIEHITDKKLLLIDISVPRNIDPRVKTNQNIELFSIDELGDVLQDGFKRRQQAIIKAQSLIQKKIKEFLLKFKKMQNYHVQKKLLLDI